MNTYIIHETYEYRVIADSPEKAIELHEAYMAEFVGDGGPYDEITFTQNYTNVYDSEGKEA